MNETQDGWIRYELSLQNRRMDHVVDSFQEPLVSTMDYVLGLVESYGRRFYIEIGHMRVVLILASIVTSIV